MLASIICALGLALILLGDFGGISRGDVICLGSATCYALHIVYTGILAKENDPALLNLVQIGTGGVIGIVIALLTEPIPAGIQTGDFLNMGYLAVFCTILPYMLSVFGQKHVKTSTSGIILSFESVFGCVFSVVFLGEELSPRFFLGAILVMCSFLVVEYGWKPVLRPVFMRKQECE